MAPYLQVLVQDDMAYIQRALLKSVLCADKVRKCQYHHSSVCSLCKAFLCANISQYKITLCAVVQKLDTGLPLNILANV